MEGQDLHARLPPMRKIRHPLPPLSFYLGLCCSVSGRRSTLPDPRACCAGLDKAHPVLQCTLRLAWQNKWQSLAVTIVDWESIKALQRLGRFMAPNMRHLFSFTAGHSMRNLAPKFKTSFRLGVFRDRPMQPPSNLAVKASRNKQCNGTILPCRH